jgi:hypothetical protein
VAYDGWMRLLTTVVLLAVAGCGRLGFDDMDNMDPMDPVLGTPVEAPPDTGLIAHWTFDNMTATGAMSTVGTDEATCSAGECPTTVAGVAGVAARFDGTTSCFHVPSLAPFNSATYTISLWVNVDDATVDQPMMMRRSGGCAAPSVRSHGPQVSHAATDSGDNHQYAWTQNVMSAGTWQHLAIRWDGTNQSVFVDGTCSCNNMPALRLVDDVSTEFTIGCDPYDSSHFAGSIDEIRVYDRALANDEMAALTTDGGRLPPVPVACPMDCTITSDFP